MAEADCGGNGGNSVPPALALPLEDVAEEEDVFVAEERGLTPKSGDEGLSPVNQLESEFLHLTIRKQVSYSTQQQVGIQEGTMPCAGVKLPADSLTAATESQGA
ncbi:hypothetical protein MHYP_G00299010 [Metynnis hypsauchen]